MAQERRHHHPLSSIAVVLFLLLLLPYERLEAAAVANYSRRGLTLSLVHRDSIHSPSYPGPLTDLQRLERAISFSRFPVVDKGDSLPSSVDITPSPMVSPADDNDDICGIAPPISYGGFFLVTLAMGTPQKVFTLVLDTGSDLTWTQCVPSNPQFRQAHPLFDPAGSSSFQYVDPEEDDDCGMPSQRKGRFCRYTVRYASGESTSGALGMETFDFYAPNAATGILSFPEVTFGCSHSSVGRYFYPTQDGVMGMGMGPLSFATQVGKYYDGRFSYCLFDQRGEGSDGTSKLLFGDDIKMVGNVQTTPFQDTGSGQSHYYLSLEDITLAGLSLGLDADVYKPGGLHQRGTLIDSGSVGYLYDPAFDALKEIISAYFGFYDYTPFDMSPLSATPLEICYEDNDDPASAFRGDIVLSYRFQGPAILDVRPKYLFNPVRDHHPPFFCLSMHRNNKMTIIGQWQQRDVRFTYDLVEEHLQFVPEVCDPSSS